jgi:hypothetical protein
MEEPQTAGRAFGVQLLRFTLVVGALLIGTGFVARYPGSLPVGWRQLDGMVASAVGRQSSNTRLYYSVVQYQALGYSYEVNDPHGNTTAPDLGTTEPVAFNPEEPAQAKLLSATPPNYFRFLFPALGILVIAGGGYPYMVARRPIKVPKVQEATVVEKPIVKKRRLELKAKLANKASALKTKIAELKSKRPTKKKKQPKQEAPKQKPVKQPKTKKQKAPLKPIKAIAKTAKAKTVQAKTHIPKKPVLKTKKAKPRKTVNPQKQAIMLSNLKLDQ